ncbi:hypothetical protein EST38_g13331 [Candolleomyces aberdarensis]|uniref:Uncharacterized protein n=1 Tax=Candolleomyces aberdarensis TaxID=2316362 RepID=A0A4Q2D2H2_9AGAR|nr:hypothetical protein EST38_g13331 [Candolleomyces aberdarensis]
MSSRQPGKRKIDSSKPTPAHQSGDVHMRSATPDEEISPTKETLRPQAHGSDRRKNFDPSKLRKPNVVVTYAPLLTQDPGPSKDTTLEGSSADGRPGSGVETAPSDRTPNALVEVEPVRFEPAPDPDLRTLETLSAVLVSSNFLSHHIKDLVWIKARLVEHQSHIVRCRNLTTKNLSSIERALYTEERFKEISAVSEA